MALGGGWREYLAIVEGKQRNVRVEPDNDALRIRVDGEEFRVAYEESNEGELCLLLNGRPQMVNVRTNGEGRYRIMLGGGELGVEIRDPMTARLGSGSGAIRQEKHVEVRSPMHGTVVVVQVREGEDVEEESPLVVLEAMKMQNALTSPIRGVVRQVRVQAGQTVEGEAVLVLLERYE